MKKSITNELGKEIEQKKKLPKEVKDEMNKHVFRNLMFAIFIILYFIFLNLGYLNIDKIIFSQDTAVFAMTSLIISIVLFERAYRNEKGYLAIHGLEMLAVALFTLFTPYTYYYLDAVVSKIMMMIPLAFAIYYTAKGAIICAQIQTKQNNKISDVKEIVKKETRKFDVNIEMDKDKEAEMAEKNEEKKPQQEEKIKTEKVKKEKTSKEPKTEKKSTKKVDSKKEETKPKKTTTKSATKKTTRVAKTKIEDKETVDKKIDTTKKRTTSAKKTTGETKTRKTTTKKETAEPAKTRKTKLKKEE